MNNKIIALDIGHVCYRIDDKIIREKLNIDKTDQEYIELYSLGEKLETGVINNKFFFSEFNRITQKEYLDSEIIKLWNTIICEPIPNMLEALEKIIKLGYQFVFFSDTSEIHKNYFWGKEDFSKYVIGEIYSYEVGVLKPDDKMYKAFEKKYGKPCFYIDDKLKNIEGGLRNNWQSLQFKTAEQFYTAFEKIMG